MGYQVKLHNAEFILIDAFDQHDFYWYFYRKVWKSVPLQEILAQT